MSEAIAGLKPEAVWRYFAEISRIPRGSKNEQQISDYVVGVAERLGLEAKQDGTLNVVVKKPASAGREGVPTVCLQGHLDMVCEKNKGVEHDFEKDPIELVREGNVLRANGTTLGADNGIAVATNLAIMEDRSLEHGPLEFLFTVDEETGLTGAGFLKPGFVESRTLLNLDSEEEGEIFVGCSGGRDTSGTWRVNFMRAPGGSVAMRVKVQGLVGGHSGLEIDKGRGNSIKTLARVLYGLHEAGARLSHIEGGNKRNAIPREAEALVFVPKDRARKAQAIANKFHELISAELATVEPDLLITLDRETGDVERQVIKKDQQERIIKALVALPHGVIKMSADIPGLVETSTNVAVISAVKSSIVLETSQRSSVASEIDEIVQTVATILELSGAKVVQDSGYPGWKPNLDSPILKVAKSTYQQLYGKMPGVQAVHAGLECGIIGEKYPGMDMISFGPTLAGVHSPDEVIYIDTVGKFWDFLLAILKNVD
ncbi:MAG: aminoacyl-histidine dipeptidase [Gemmatimonadota bacterium]|nr:MAG: aminoacyl-histidine dipeptidase [Gemmatimonadota bacterium]